MIEYGLNHKKSQDCDRNEIAKRKLDDREYRKALVKGRNLKRNDFDQWAIGSSRDALLDSLRNMKEEFRCKKGSK